MFKVGDNVMVVGGDSDLIGKIGTINYIDNDFEYPYDVRCNLFARCFNEAEIILMEAAID